MTAKRILFLAQHFVTLYSFRKELIKELCDRGHEVYLSLPESEENEFFKDLGCKIIPTSVDRRGINPIKDIKLLAFYRKMIPEIDPDIIFSYTIKPNIYGTLATNGRRRKNGEPFRQVCNITGTGGTFLNDNWVSRICRVLYRHSVKKCYKVFFQNSGDRDLFLKNGMVKDNWDMLPGSGVNLEQFHLEPMPEGDNVNFIFIGRVMELKGIGEYLEAARQVKRKYPNTSFYIAGFVEEDYWKKRIDECSDSVIPLGFQKDIISWIKKSHCTVLPSHGGEGVPNVILESSAMGRVCIGSRIDGTDAAIEDGVSGFLFTPGDADALAECIEKVVCMDPEQRKQMGYRGRQKVEKEFDRKVVIDKYLSEVERI